MDIFFGVIVFLIPVAIVLFIAWGEGLLWHFIGFIAFTITAIIFYKKFLSNFSEWQLGLFGVLFALAMVGISAMFSKKN